MTTDEMAREIYEFYTGKKVGHLNLDGTYVICPPLATSLDAWRPIWEAMTDEQVDEISTLLISIRGTGHASWQATPMHHLTAAYAVVKGA